jgi:hypothetical protein
MWILSHKPKIMITLNYNATGIDPYAIIGYIEDITSDKFSFHAFTF